MKRLALAAAGAAVLGLGACTSSTNPSAAPADHGTRALKAPVSCSRQYRDWTHTDGKGVMHALAAVTRDASITHAHQRGNGTHALGHDLARFRRAVADAARHPIPACADPRGYWDVLLMHVNAAAAGANSASSVRAAMHDVPNLHHHLVVEVARTAQ